MSDIANLFEKLTLNDNIDNLMDDGKEINDLINSFDNLTIEKQHKCINNYKWGGGTRNEAIILNILGLLTLSPN